VRAEPLKGSHMYGVKLTNLDLELTNLEHRNAVEKAGIALLVTS